MTILGGVLSLLAAAVASPTPAAALPAGVTVATPTPTPAPVDVRELADEVEALRSEVARLREGTPSATPTPREDAAGERRDGVFPADLARRAPGTLRLGGVITGAAVLSGDRTSEAAIPRAALFGFAPIGERVSFAGEVTMLPGGDAFLDGGNALPSRGDVYLRIGFADVAIVPRALVLRAGLVPIPVGRVNLESDESTRDLLLRPVEQIYLIPTPWMDAGAGLLGTAHAGPIKIEWQAVVVGGIDSGIDLRNGLRDSRVAPAPDINSDKGVAGRVTVRPFAGLEAGLSAYTAAYSPGGGRRLTLEEGDVAGEVGSHVVFEGDLAYASTDGGVGVLGAAIPRSMIGGSMRVTVRFLSRHLASFLPESMQASTIAVSARYSFVDTDLGNDDSIIPANTPESFSRRDRAGIGVAFRPAPGCVIRAEYEMRGEGGANYVNDDRAVASITAAF